MDAVFTECKHCFDFIAKGEPELSEKLEKMEERLRNPKTKKYPEDLKTLCKYLLFCAPNVAMPIGGNMVTAVQKAINEAGSAENIKVWCFPTPQQRLIFSKPKIVLQGPWGSGKTMFMVAEAIRLAQLGEKVLYLLFANKEVYSSSKKSLLALDLEEKFKKFEHVKVETIFFKAGH